MLSSTHSWVLYFSWLLSAVDSNIFIKCGQHVCGWPCGHIWTMCYFLPRGFKSSDSGLVVVAWVTEPSQANSPLHVCSISNAEATAPSGADSQEQPKIQESPQAFKRARIWASVPAIYGEICSHICEFSGLSLTNALVRYGLLTEHGRNVAQCFATDFWGSFL